MRNQLPPQPQRTRIAVHSQDPHIGDGGGDFVGADGADGVGRGGDEGEVEGLGFEPGLDFGGVGAEFAGFVEGGFGGGVGFVDEVDYVGNEGEGGAFGGGWEADLDLGLGSGHRYEVFAGCWLWLCFYEIYRLSCMGTGDMLHSLWYTYMCPVTADSYLVGREDGLACLKSAACSNAREQHGRRLISAL